VSQHQTLPKIYDESNKEVRIINTVVVVVCEHGESPAFKKRENWR